MKYLVLEIKTKHAVLIIDDVRNRDEAELILVQELTISLGAAKSNYMYVNITNIRTVSA